METFRHFNMFIESKLFISVFLALEKYKSANMFLIAYRKKVDIFRYGY